MKELLKRVWTDPKVGVAVMLPMMSLFASLVVALAKEGPAIEEIGMALQQWAVSLGAVRLALFADSPNAIPPYPTEPGARP